MKYLFTLDESFGFKDSDINEILETDIQISNEIYNKFFELQSQGKQFKIKNINGFTFEEIFEEVIPKPVEPGVIEPSSQELLTQQVASLAIENKKKDMAIESLVKTVSTLNIKLKQLEGGTN